MYQQPVTSIRKFVEECCWDLPVSLFNECSLGSLGGL